MYVRRARQAFAAAERNRNDGIFRYLSLSLSLSLNDGIFRYLSSVPACYDFECLYMGSGCEGVYMESERGARARGERDVRVRHRERDES